MQCIFCHTDSSTSISVEHIIPESLGNKHHFLPKGYVCDECNHYFAISFFAKLFQNQQIKSKNHNYEKNEHSPHRDIDCALACRVPNPLHQYGACPRCFAIRSA